MKEVSEDLNEPITFIKIGTNNSNEDILTRINEQRDKLSCATATHNEIKEEYLRLFPNPEAFLLVEDAEYDFFAPLINLFIGGEKGIAEGKIANCNEEKEVYNMPTLKEIIGDIEKQIKNYKNYKFFTNLEEAFKNISICNFEPTIENGTWAYNPQEFVSCTREICAILANTKECEKSGKEFGYKGKNREKIKDILKSLGFVEKYHCKLENYKSDYSILVNQLIFWGLKKALVVIGGIELLGEEFRKIIES